MAKTDQGQKSGNAGDILKHSLICDVLQKCIADKWEKITYAETHAGAGIYSSKGQDPQPPSTSSKSKKTKEEVQVEHIKALFKKHSDAKEEKKDTYWKILNALWEPLKRAEIDPDTEIKYSGSAYLAASILKATNEIFDIRLTEYNLEACHQLKNSLNGLLPTINVNDHIMQVGFQGQIDWLTKNDKLVLIIDPFKLSKDSSDINEGGIDQDTLLNVIEKVKNKVNAVVGFWYPIGQDNVNQYRLSASFDKTILEKYGELNCRKYWFGSFHFIFIGFGGGVEIVNDLSLQSDLQNRWFDLDIKEKLFPQRLKQALNEIHACCDNFKITFRNIEKFKITLENIDNLKELLEKNDNAKIFAKFKRINITPQCIDDLEIVIQQIIDKL